MIFDFTIIKKDVDGLVVYAKSVYKELVEHFPVSENLYLFREGIGKKGVDKIKYIILHRIFGFFFSRKFYYSPTHHGPILNPNKAITIHDITPLLHPNKSFKQFVYYRILLTLSIRNSKRIYTVSEFSKKLIIDNFGVNSSLVKVIHNGTDINLILAEPLVGVPSNYLLFVGIHSEYKNFELCYKAIRGISKDIPIVVVGNWFKIPLIVSNDEFVFQFSNLSYQNIRFLYENAKGLMYASTLEGFGLPALEAARLNCPVITSRNSPMHEFLGPLSARYVDPNSLDSIKSQIQSLLNDSELSFKLSLEAYQKTKNLTWKMHVQILANDLKTLF